MDKNTIKKLLDRYFEGASSIKEEQLLKTYFTSNNIDSEFEEFKHLFAFFAHEKQIKTSSSFELPSIRKPAKTVQLRARRWAAAAILVLSISSWYFMNNSTNKKQLSQQIDWSKYEPKTEQQAIQLTLEAFKKTSSAMRQGTRAVGNEVRELKGLVKFK